MFKDSCALAQVVTIRTYLHLVVAGRTTSFDEVTSHPQALAALFWPCWPPRFPTILASAPAATAKLKTQVYDRVGVYCNVNERDVATLWNDETLNIFTPTHTCSHWEYKCFQAVTMSLCAKPPIWWAWIGHKALNIICCCHRLGEVKAWLGVSSC